MCVWVCKTTKCVIRSASVFKATSEKQKNAIRVCKRIPAARFSPTRPVRSSCRWKGVQQSQYRKCSSRNFAYSAASLRKSERYRYSKLWSGSRTESHASVIGELNNTSLFMDTMFRRNKSLICTGLYFGRQMTCRILIPRQQPVRLQTNQALPLE